MAKTTEVVKATDGTVPPLASTQVLKASKALLGHLKKTIKEAAGSATKKNLLAADYDEEDGSRSLAETPVFVSMTLKRHWRDSNRLKPSRIRLPHTLNTDHEKTICLIVADPQRAYKDIVASDEFPEALRKRVTRVVDLKHLKAKFRVYEAQRKLFSEHDIFLADDRIVNRLPQALGKTFYKTTTKRPVPVVLHSTPKKSKADKARPKTARNGGGAEEGDGAANAIPAPAMAKEIEAALGAALVNLNPSPQTNVKVGYADWDADQVAANAEAVVSSLVENHVPGKWAGVRDVFLRGTETASLPIWQTDELWLDGARDVLAEGSEELKALEAKRLQQKEKPNVGKKRKALTEEAAEDQPQAGAGPAAKKAKKSKKERSTARSAAESSDNLLDREIKQRKERLRKQKKAAKEAIEA